MDRLHDAIAKARAAREKDGQRRRPGKEHLAHPLDSLAEWSALPEIRPSETDMDRSKIVAQNPVPKAKAFDLMRTNLLRQLQEKKWTRVAITSPSSACGKTTVALNLAFSLARLTGIRVMVLEFDLRRPSICEALGIDLTPSFSSVLQGNAAPGSQLLRIGSNLAFGLSAAPVASPAELLSSDRAADTIDAIEAKYRPNVILFDMPPMASGDDTIAFLDQVDCALLVAAAEETPVDQIERCGKDLGARTQVLGVVLNKCRMMESDESYGY
jgi:Mrp family chromosome partitioning ATPase